jgi:hypothetical protein
MFSIYLDLLYSPAALSHSISNQLLICGSQRLGDRAWVSNIVHIKDVRAVVRPKNACAYSNRAQQPDFSDPQLCIDICQYCVSFRLLLTQHSCTSNLRANFFTDNINSNINDFLCTNRDTEMRRQTGGASRGKFSRWQSVMEIACRQVKTLKRASCRRRHTDAGYSNKPFLYTNTNTNANHNTPLSPRLLSLLGGRC